MSHANVNLFIGYAVDESLQKIINKTNPHLVSLFINNNSEYLHRIQHAGQPFLGKFVGRLLSLETMDSLEANIKSLLQKVAPTYPLEQHPLQLLAVTTNP